MNNVVMGPSSSPTVVSLQKQVGAEQVKFNFRAKDSEVAVEKLDALVDSGILDVDKLKEELAPYIVNPCTRKAKPAEKKVKAENVKTKRSFEVQKTRGRGETNEKRIKALAMFAELTGQGLESSKIIEKVMSELQITKANTYYYYSRVWKKA